MKKIYIVFFLSSLFCSFKGFSQSLTISMPDTVGSDSCGMDIAYDQGDSIINNTPNNLNIDVVRVQNVATANWQSAFCLDVCYLPAKDSVRFILQPSEHQIFIFHFYTDAGSAGSGTAIMKFKDVNNPSNTFYKTFYGSTVCANGIHETSSSAARVSIYPSPVISGKDFTVTIANTNNTSANTLSVYDMLGNKVRTSIVRSGKNILNIDLPAGVYSYTIISENEKIASGKIAVVR